MRNENINDYDDIILAENVIDSTNPITTGLNNNILVIGGTGAGKTMSYTEPQLLFSKNRSLIISVTKRTLISKYKESLLKRGYKVEIIDIDKPQNSTIGYDPLNFIRTNEDMLSLAKGIVDTGNKKDDGRDKYWDNCASQLIASLISMSKELLPIYKENDIDADTSFYGVLKINKELEFKESTGSGFTQSSIDDELKALYEYNPNSYAVQCFKSVKGLASKTLSCVSSVVNTAFNNMFTPAAIELMQAEKVIDFKDIANEKTALFIVTSPVDESSHMLANLMFYQIFKELYDISQMTDGRLSRQVHIICDDFAVSAKIYRFEKYISIFREIGISVSILIQSETQLVDMYGTNAASTIINNCDRILYLGGMDIMTCQNIARRLDVPLSDVLYMPIEEAAVIKRGSKPIKTRRFQICNTNDYKVLITKRI